MARYWLFMAIMAIKKKEKCVSKLWKKGCDLPPLIFAEMSIGLIHKKSVSNLWIGRDPPPPLYTWPLLEVPQLAWQDNFAYIILYFWISYDPRSSQEYTTCIKWQVTCDMWHKTCDMWHVTCGMCHVTFKKRIYLSCCIFLHSLWPQEFTRVYIM